MIKFFKKSITLAFAMISVIFTFIPENCFEKYVLLTNYSIETNVIVNRIITFIVVFGISILGNAVYLLFKRNIHINGHNYNIHIKYGNLLKMRKCKKIIPFDECFTTSVGSYPCDINPDSICGQYLKEHPIKDIKSLINDIHLHPAENKSKYQGKECYTSGKLVPNGDYLLLAFAKLNEDGLGEFTREEYLECLSVLWKEIDKYYGQKDVCIPILGSGTTRIDGISLTQQELLDLIIESYKLSTYKIKAPYKLYIICKKKKNFSLNKIGETL